MKLQTAALIFAITFGVQAEETSRPGFQEGANFGKANTGKVITSIQNFNPKKVPGFVTAEPPETAYQSKNFKTDGIQTAAQAEKVQDLKRNYENRPKDFVKTGAEWLKKGLGIEQNTTVATDLTEHYIDCKPTSPIGIPQYQLLSCDEFTEGDTKTCTVGQVVEVDAKHTYECKATRQREKLTCQKILNIRIDEKSEQTPSCTQGAVIASGEGYSNLAATVRCELDQPTLNVLFTCGWRHNPSTHSVIVNGTGSLNFSDCKPKRRSGDTLGVLPYSLLCNKNERCHLKVASLLSLAFDRPRSIRTIIKTPVDEWDNQCAALEGRIR